MSSTRPQPYPGTYRTVPNGNTAGSAATVPGRARTPLAVTPTALGRPASGPRAITGRPHQVRRQLQQRPHGQ